MYKKKDNINMLCGDRSDRKNDSFSDFIDSKPPSSSPPPPPKPSSSEQKK